MNLKFWPGFDEQPAREAPSSLTRNQGGSRVYYDVKISKGLISKLLQCILLGPRLIISTKACPQSGQNLDMGAKIACSETQSPGK
jgi:hypothetical protein